MIPEFNQSGVLPPFLPGESPTRHAGMAPYKTSIVDLVLRYAHSPERRAILQGLLDYRKQLRMLGISDGFQWIDGSFVEDIEANRSRPPADIDLVTFACRPVDHNDDSNWSQLIYHNQDVFIPKEAQRKYQCDAYFVDLDLDPKHVVDMTRYWFGLFSHQRDSYLWKGMLEVPLNCDDDNAFDILSRETANA